MQYKILIDVDAGNLSECVRLAVEAEWELQGGISVTAMPQGVVFAQAITNGQDAPIPPAIDNRSLTEILDDIRKRLTP